MSDDQEGDNLESSEVEQLDMRKSGVATALPLPYSSGYFPN